jgi:RND superfamily putative drug exporter
MARKKGVFRATARLVLRYPKAIVVAWVFAALAGAALNALFPLSDVVTFSQQDALPHDTPSYLAQQIAAEQFPGRIPPSGVTVVVVGTDVTAPDARDLVLDLDDAVGAAAALGDGETASLALRAGGEAPLRPVRYLHDPANATIYRLYESFARELAANLTPLVHQQVQFTHGALGVYYGVPAAFLDAYVASFQDNATAHGAALAVIAAMPPELQPLAQGYYAVWSPLWSLSFLNASLAGAPPAARVAAVIDQAIPQFAAVGGFPPELAAYQSGFPAVFSPANFQDAALADAYAFGAFAQTGLADAAFIESLYRELPAGPTPAELGAFARHLVATHTLGTMPLRFPFDVSAFYVSADRTVLLANYEFTRPSRFAEAGGSEPVIDNVVHFREIARALERAYPGYAVYVTGTAASDLDNEELFSGSSEFLVTIVLAIVLTCLFFRSAVTWLFPITAIGIAIALSLVFVYFVALYLLTVDSTITAVLQVVLLATGVDYSIFLLSRYRDERLRGHGVRRSVRVAITWAGESIATSGGAVMISFAALSLGSFPFIRALGITIGAAVTIAILLALTFIPSVVLLAGDRVFWPFNRVMAKAQAARRRGHRSAVERYFEGSARFSMRHAKAIMIAALLVTGPALYVVLTSRPSFDLTAGAAPTESSRGLDALEGSFGAGLFLRSFVIVRFPDPVFLPDGNLSTAKLDALDAVRARLLADHPVLESVAGATNPQGDRVDYRNLSSLPEPERTEVRNAIASYVGVDERTVRLFLVFASDPFSHEAVTSVDAIEATIAAVQASEPELQGAELYLGGVTAILHDVNENTTRDLQLMAVIVFAGLFLVLLVVLGSVLVPLRSIVTILLSIVWALALSTAFFQLWKGLDLIFVLPLILFVLAMGLGMDYDIFIITRVREEVARGRSDEKAIYVGMRRTGAIISAAGAIMAGSFFTLALSPSPVVSQIGFALAVVILLDAMVVRIYLVPAILVLAGKYNWWAPGPLRRLQRLGERRAEAPGAKPPDPGT